MDSIDVQKSSEEIENHQTRQKTKGEHGMRKIAKPLSINFQRNENTADKHIRGAIFGNDYLKKNKTCKIKINSIAKRILVGHI
jgi:hypothetical protein